MTVPPLEGVETPIPSVIPSPGLDNAPTVIDPYVPTSGTDYSSYDIAVGGLGFRFATSNDNPLLRQTAEWERQRVDQAEEAGENTLTGWWQKSQASFHGGAGLLNLEPPFPSDKDHIRYDLSKNVDVWTPGVVSRLPGTAVLTAIDPIAMCGVWSNTDGDCVAYLTNSGVLARVSLTGALTTYGSAPTGCVALCTDGSTLYVATSTEVWRVDSPGSATKLHTYPSTSNVVIGWAKARLMVALDRAVYEADAGATSTVAFSPTQLRYTHPTVTWKWIGFAEAPQAVLAYGQAVGRSDILAFTLDSQGAVPVLSGGATVATLPSGEVILDAIGTQGNLLTLATSLGIRCCTFDALYGRLSLGPLTVTGQPITKLAARDRFVFGCGLAPDEGGLIRVDRGTLVDDAGRAAWAPDLIGPVKVASPARYLTSTPLTGKLVFHLVGQGIVAETSTVNIEREAWLRTSRIRFATTEDKLFKRARVRGDVSAGVITTTAITPMGSRQVSVQQFINDLAPEFSLPSGGYEWLQLRFDFAGTNPKFTGYGLKALAGVRRERILQFVLSCYDQETDKYLHQTHGGRGSARARLLALESLDSTGDEVMLEEFTSQGVNRTRVIIQSMQYQQTGRPTPLSDAGGTIKLQLRTIT